MEEIKVGNYIRTKNGYILKVEEKTIIFNYGYKEQYIDMESTQYGLPYEEEIVKHSKNIIDLIEVEDFAIMNCYGFLVKKNITKDDIWELKTGNYQLIKILTKERFNSESYEV